MDQASIHIRAQVGQLGNQLREKHPWLVTRQNALGGSIMVLALMLMAFAAYGYLQLNWPAWLTVVIVAIATSFIHELEHDLIHYAYFKKRPVIHNLMLLMCWLTRPGTVNPWIRRRLHLLHHKVSGTRQDVEERGITNGMPWSPLRLLMLCDGTLAMIFRHKKNRQPKHLLYTLLKGFVAYLPVGMLYFLSWYSYLAFHVSEFFELAVHWPLWFIELVPMLDILAVTLLWPFFIRSFCLNFISSNMHYYGDIEEKNITQQTQVWTSKWLWPLHLFCFNFGSTHGIHHFVVKDPFYIRQAIAKDAHIIMKKHGVRFNDYSTFKRANRYQLTK
ncbi:hypothetical protein A9Q73_00375 [Bermanella sp. 47_1433_sub80_T6]|nr:hypothetical protein A9Q73_00375 [Bermanella sp. 47_1433_sub80_T6]